MKAVLIAVMAVLSFASVTESFASSKQFMCRNPPARVWGEYICIQGEFDPADTSRIFSLQYGVCEGSDAAMEEEFVGDYPLEKASAHHDATLRASSNEWRDARAFDLKLDETGSSTLYLQPESFHQANSVGRFKYTLDGVKKDIRLQCTFDQ